MISTKLGTHDLRSGNNILHLLNHGWDGKTFKDDLKRSLSQYTTYRDELFIFAVTYIDHW
jgi:hypothetical protein